MLCLGFIYDYRSSCDKWDLNCRRCPHIIEVIIPLRRRQTTFVENHFCVESSNYFLSDFKRNFIVLCLDAHLRRRSGSGAATKVNIWELFSVTQHLLYYTQAYQEEVVQLQKNVASNLRCFVHLAKKILPACWLLFA